MCPQLLPDGRVLISGSDPQTPGLPEEMRIEVYYPPYLTEGRIQPNVTVQNNDWEYGGQYTIDVELYQGTISDMRVSLVAGEPFQRLFKYEIMSCSTVLFILSHREHSR